MKEGGFTDNMEVAVDAERILQRLYIAGPQDVYQLTEGSKKPEETQKALNLLIERELIETRNNSIPQFSDDPYSIVYGLSRGKRKDSIGF